MHGKLPGLLAVAAIGFLGQGSVTATPSTDSTKSASPGALPSPTGQFAVGKVSVQWRDESRVEPLSPNLEPRELMVDIWYPAESSGTPAKYLDAEAYERALRPDGFQGFFRQASETLRQGVKTHAFAAAPYARSAQPSPRKG
jgi:hypothetical protein